MNYVLIMTLIVQLGGQTATTIQTSQFETKKLCMEAGKEWGEGIVKQMNAQSNFVSTNETCAPIRSTFTIASFPPP